MWTIPDLELVLRARLLEDCLRAEHHHRRHHAAPPGAAPGMWKRLARLVRYARQPAARRELGGPARLARKVP